MAARKKKNLVIVESPAKAKTIQKYLGSDFEVAASRGHVRDLPKSRFGIDIEAGWVPTYQPLADHKGVLAELKKHAAKADLVYLAPDPDREGEAIAWHLKEALKLDDDRIRRVTFNEITKRAVQEAFSHAGAIDMDRVMAQEARRFLDRVVGYKLSPLLRKKVARHLSAGRVQSVAVRLIVDREREIQGFKPEEYWKITALLSPEGTVEYQKPAKSEAKKKGPGKAEADDNGETEEPPAIPEVPQGDFLAELAEWKGQKFSVNNSEDADRIFKTLQGAPYVVAKVEQKDRQEKPSAPFTTSTLQQQANIRLRSSAKKTMMLAQKLYEGMDLGSEGSVALITYMRTDSVRVSEDALKTCREHISSKYGAPYLPAQAQSLRFRQERPGGPRSDPAHRSVVHAGTRGEIFAPRSPAAVHAHLQSLRGQPDDAGGLRRHQRGCERRRGCVQGPGQDHEVRRLSQGAAHRGQAGRCDPAGTYGETGPRLA